MDQKNTIVKCYASPNCLFNHNGVCDNYVITIGADGSCQEYVETESEETNIIHEHRYTCKDCVYFQDTKLLQCPCEKGGYAYRHAPACEDFKQ